MSKILIVDDEPDIRELIRETLEPEGYDTLIAKDGEEAKRLCRVETPHLILLDVMMPGESGYDLCRELRQDVKTAHVPVIMITALGSTEDKVTGLEAGADDFITKPFEIEELIARVRAQLRNVERSLLSELTGIPGNTLIERAIRRILEQNGRSWAILYIDLDYFKPYNDVYGFIRGNEMIKATADVLQEAVARVGDGSEFVGHIGGDDFVVITVPERAVSLSQAIIAGFEEKKKQLYPKKDLERGFIVTADRQGHTSHIPLVTVSIGVVTNRCRKIRNYGEVGEIAAEVKKKAKAIPGNAYYIDQRRSKVA